MFGWFWNILDALSPDLRVPEGPSPEDRRKADQAHWEKVLGRKLTADEYQAMLYGMIPWQAFREIGRCTEVVVVYYSGRNHDRLLRWHSAKDNVAAPPEVKIEHMQVGGEYVDVAVVAPKGGPSESWRMFP